MQLSGLSLRLCISCITVALFALPTLDFGNQSSAQDQPDSTEKVDDQKRVSVEVARERAKLSHNIYSATLDVMHHRYFNNSRASVPARALEDVFDEIARVENMKARWFAVNAKAMSIDHEPQDEFEKQAAKAIAAGKSEFELVEGGLYRRAAGISLMDKGCLICHLRFGASGKTKRFAGLAISIPITKD